MMFYKNLSKSLATTVNTILFNKSMKERVFPDMWRIRFISPIFKDDVTNYCVISILCAMSTIFEKLLFVTSFERFVRNMVFVTMRSTLSNLMEFVTLASVANAGQVDVLYTDFLTRSYSSLSSTQQIKQFWLQ